MRDHIAEFKAYNATLAWRSPELMRYKVARMAPGPFPFYRGTFHLFLREVLGELIRAQAQVGCAAFAQPALRPPRLAGGQGEEVFGQQRDVFQALPEGRFDQADDGFMPGRDGFPSHLFMGWSFD